MLQMMLEGNVIGASGISGLFFLLTAGSERREHFTERDEMMAV
jgi:hypothetical protein